MLPELFAPLIAQQEQMCGCSVLCHLLFWEERAQIFGNEHCVLRSSLGLLQTFLIHSISEISLDWDAVVLDQTYFS